MTRLFFQEYEAFAASLREASMTLRMTSFEEPKWTLQYAVAGSLNLQQGYEGGGSIAEGATFSDGWVFYHQSRPGHTNGQVATQDEVFAAPPGSEFCLVCHPCHDWLTVFVPTSFLFQTPPELEFASSARPQLLKPPPHVTERFTSLVRRFLAAVESRPQMVDSPVAVESFQNELLAAAKELLIRNQHSPCRHFVRWRGQAKSAVELAIRDPDLSLSISDLARTSGVPERTLRTAFQKCFGLSPVEYLRILRLHHARQRLLASCPDQTTVTEIGYELGFWDLGRFAGAYRELFGELPSATLRKPSRRSASIRHLGLLCGELPQRGSSPSPAAQDGPRDAHRACQ
ncbi:MAG: helix-turn-helix transcriptional regulator [Pirellulaceae bacterium]|nr:helix-turn-helix transcriptional regulator [Pirellulaceae bacterium]